MLRDVLKLLEEEVVEISILEKSHMLKMPRPSNWQMATLLSKVNFEFQECFDVKLNVN